MDHQLFAVTKLDATGDGRDEIVVCSWDGQTYLLDQERRSVRFQLEETVSGFCSGKYSIQLGAPAIPALVYATFNNKVLAKHYHPKQEPHLCINFAVADLHLLRCASPFNDDFVFHSEDRQLVFRARHSRSPGSPREKQHQGCCHRCGVPEIPG